MDKAKLLKSYNKLTDVNNHNEAAMLLIKTFGTQDEVDKLQSIITKHERRGHLLYEEQHERFLLSNKYYKFLIKLN